MLYKRRLLFYYIQKLWLNLKKHHYYIILCQVEKTDNINIPCKHGIRIDFP